MRMARLAASPSTSAAAQRVALGPGDALVEDLLLQQVDELAVLGVHGAHRAELARAGKLFTSVSSSP
jgi:hypothetical protein